MGGSCHVIIPHTESPLASTMRNPKAYLAHRITAVRRADAVPRKRVPRRAPPAAFGAPAARVPLPTTPPGAEAAPPRHPKAAAAPAAAALAQTSSASSVLFRLAVTRRLRDFSDLYLGDCLPLDDAECSALAAELDAQLCARAARVAVRPDAGGMPPAWHFGVLARAILAQMDRDLRPATKPEGGGKLLYRLTCREVTPEHVAWATPDVLFPDGPYDLALRAAADADGASLSSAARDAAQLRARTAFVCGKCRSSNVTYTTAQTRSADEPATAFFCCLACSNRWRG